jgi:putative ABC transport system substrate-binding protein
MKRREFIALLGASAAAWSRAASAQQPTKVHRIAIVHPTLPLKEMAATTDWWAAFVSELSRLGHVEGANLIIDSYSGEGDTERLPELARRVVHSEPNVILAISLVMAQPLKDATVAIPIVALTGDPVAGGLAASVAHPGGNITGVVIDAGVEVWGKRVDLLRELLPKVATVAMPLQRHYWDIPLVKAIRQIAHESGLLLTLLPLDSPLSEAEYRRAFSALSSERTDALMVADAPEDTTYRGLIVQLIEELRLPAIYATRLCAEIGGLIEYSPDILSLIRHAAHQTDEILKGAKAADIPFYQETTFRLVVNLKTAKALGLTVPASLLARADEVIE